MLFGIDFIAGEGLIRFGKINQHLLFTETCEWGYNLTIHLQTKDCYVQSYTKQSASQRLLIPSSDVQLNPGPLKGKGEILQAIRASKDDVPGELGTEIYDQLEQKLVL